ncbi:MAG TPA: EF-hand domain-containing protein, partial [Burkholderiales bacterium]
MLTRTIIAAALAGAFAVPLAVHAADYGTRSSSTPSASTRGGAQADGSNTSQSDIANTPGKPGSSSPSSGEHAGVSASEFSRLDKNHDGYLSKDEVKLHPVLRSRFASLDKDHDGKLSQSEVSSGTTASTESRTRLSRNDTDTTGSSTSNVNPSRSTRGADNHAVTGSAG